MAGSVYCINYDGIRLPRPMTNRQVNYANQIARVISMTLRDFDSCLWGDRSGK